MTHYSVVQILGYISGGRRFITKEGEIVLKDKKDIICVLCQGADEKTKVREETRNVLFYSYAIPGIDGIYLRGGFMIAAQTMVEFGRGILRGLDVFTYGDALDPILHF